MSCITCDYTAGGNPPKNYQINLTGDKKKKYGHPQFALLRGDVVVPDPLDLAAWRSLAESGAIQISPCGVLNLGTPNFNTSTDNSACGETEVLETVYQPTFHTYDLDPVNLKHIEYLEDLLESYKCFRIIIFDCDGNPYFTKVVRKRISGASTDNLTAPIGNDFGMVQIPHPVQGDSNLEKWQLQVEIKIPGENMLAPAKVPGLLKMLMEVASAPAPTPTPAPVV